MSHGHGSTLSHQFPMLGVAASKLGLVCFPPLPPGFSHKFSPVVVTGSSDGFNAFELLRGQVLLAHEESNPVVPKESQHIGIIGLCRFGLNRFLFPGRGLIVLETLLGKGSPGEGSNASARRDLVPASVAYWVTRVTQTPLGPAFS